MKTGKSPAEYRFDDSRNLFNATIVGNLLLAVFMAAPNLADFPYSGHVQTSFYTACLAFALQRLYNWGSQKANALILIVYLAACGAEYAIWGLPGSPLSTKEDPYMGKGLFLEIVLWSLPLIYIGLRVLLALPIVLTMISLVPRSS
ncbi:MAG: hypothetical protein KDD10_14565 [Phaeodactylibacter sp.]|nr:hypothetical protein [Phaeodactylibacter sp.]MCB9296204.1 hypothetical protein [Lewinellaceae bacterium]